MRTRYAHLLALAAIAAAWFLLYHDVALSFSDEGLVADSALRVLDGEMEGRDFPDVWSFIPYVVAFGFKLGGVNLITMRVVLLAFKVGTALLLYLIARRFVPGAWALVPYLAVLLFSGPSFKSYTAFSLAILLYSALRWNERRTPASAALAGAGLGVSLLLRPDLGGLGALLAGVMFAEVSFAERRMKGFLNLAAPPISWRQWLAAAAGLGAVVSAGLVVASLMAARHATAVLGMPVERLFSSAGLEQMLAERLDPAVTGSPVATLVLFFHDLFVNSAGGYIGLEWPPVSSAFLTDAFIDVWLVVLSLLSPVLLTVMRWRRPCRALALVMAVVTASLVKYLLRADMAHLLQHVPFLALSLTCLAWPAQVSTPARRDGKLPKLLQAGLVLFVAALAVASFESRDLYGGGIGVLAKAEVRLDLPAAPVRLPAETATAIRKVLTAIQTHLRPGEKLLALPYCPMLYLLISQPGPFSLSFDYRRLHDSELSGRPGSYLAELREAVRKKSIGLVALDLRYQTGQEGVLNEERFWPLLARLTEGWPVVHDGPRFRLYRNPDL